MRDDFAREDFDLRDEVSKIVDEYYGDCKSQDFKDEIIDFVDSMGHDLVRALLVEYEEVIDDD